MIPYTCELVALRSLRPAVFSILMSLEPAAAALAGFVVLGEVLEPLQLVAIACVVVASVGATRSGATIVRAGPGLTTSQARLTHLFTISSHRGDDAGR